MPVLFIEKDPVYAVWKIDENIDQLLSILELSVEDLARFQSLRSVSRQKEWLSTRALLNQSLGYAAQIDYKSNGAPYLSESSQFSLSISHTKGYAAILLQKDRPAGIDIEFKSDRVKKIRSRFMSEEESQNINQAYEVDHLLLYWCAKEALFKMIGQQDVDFIRHLHIEPFVFARKGVLTAIESRTEKKEKYQLGFRVEDDYVMTFSL